jgi:predicted small secreted protein
VRKIIVTIMVVFFLTVLAGCNTMHGLGKDMKNLGKKIEDKAE